MMKLAILAVAAMALGSVLAGCNNTDTDTQTTEPTTKLDEGGATPVVFANDKGEALCPVMGGAIADTSGLKYEDYEGKRYYFCCDECPDQFRADPAKFADGKAMPSTPKM